MKITLPDYAIDAGEHMLGGAGVGRYARALAEDVITAALKAMVEKGDARGAVAYPDSGGRWSALECADYSEPNDFPAIIIRTGEPTT